MRQTARMRPFCLVALTVVVSSAWACHRPTSTRESDADADGDVAGDGDADSDADADGSPCLPDPDADLDADDVDAEGDADLDDAAPVDADEEVDADAAPVDADAAPVDADAAPVDADAEADADLGACPADMVPIGSACIDIWEASRSDATEGGQGSAGGAALSQPGVVPWHVNPMTTEAFAEFEAACLAADKRLCTREEWEQACCGGGRPSCPSLSSYVYGDAYDLESCNTVDTFCDDHCAAEGITPCDTSANCGYVYDCFHVVSTGAMEGCTGAVGTFDINGNVWEVVPVPEEEDARGFQLRGGAFNCAGAAGRVNCGFNANWDRLFAGFRCCRDR